MSVSLEITVKVLPEILPPESIRLWTTWDASEIKIPVGKEGGVNPSLGTLQGSGESVIQIEFPVTLQGIPQGRSSPGEYANEFLYIQLFCTTDPILNDLRLGYTKQGDCRVCAAEFFMAEGGSSKKIIEQPMTMKTYLVGGSPTEDGEPLKTGVCSIVVKETSVKLKERGGGDKAAATVPSSMDENEKKIVHLANAYTKTMMKEISGGRFSAEECQEVISGAFICETPQLMENFFYMPSERLSPKIILGDRNEPLKNLYITLFEECTRKYCEFLRLNSTEKTALYFLLASSPETAINPTIKRSTILHLCNIYVWAMSYIPQSMPYISDLACIPLTKDDAAAYQQLMNVVKADKGLTDKERKDRLWQAWVQMVRKKCVPIDSFQDIFATKGGDCEDSAMACQKMHVIFLRYMECSGRGFPYPIMGFIGTRYVSLTCLSTVSSAKVESSDTERPEMPTEKEFLQQNKNIGGHMFSLFRSIQAMQEDNEEGAVVLEYPFRKMDQGAGSDALQNICVKYSARFSPELWKNLPTLVAEGTGPEFPGVDNFRSLYGSEGGDLNMWDYLQRRAVATDECTTELVKALESTLGDPTVSFEMVTHTMKADRIASKFYRTMVGCYSAICYDARFLNEGLKISPEEYNRRREYPTSWVWLSNKSTPTAAMQTQQRITSFSLSFLAPTTAPAAPRDPTNDYVGASLKEILEGTTSSMGTSRCHMFPTKMAAYEVNQVMKKHMRPVHIITKSRRALYNRIPEDSVTRSISEQTHSSSYYKCVIYFAAGHLQSDEVRAVIQTFAKNFKGDRVNRIIQYEIHGGLSYGELQYKTNYGLTSIDTLHRDELHITYEDEQNIVIN